MTFMLKKTLLQRIMSESLSTQGLSAVKQALNQASSGVWQAKLFRGMVIGRERGKTRKWKRERDGELVVGRLGWLQVAAHTLILTDGRRHNRSTRGKVVALMAISCLPACLLVCLTGRSCERCMMTWCWSCPRHRGLLPVLLSLAFPYPCHFHSQPHPLSLPSSFFTRTDQ